MPRIVLGFLIQRRINSVAGLYPGWSGAHRGLGIWHRADTSDSSRSRAGLRGHSYALAGNADQHRSVPFGLDDLGNKSGGPVERILHPAHTGAIGFPDG